MRTLSLDDYFSYLGLSPSHSCDAGCEICSEQSYSVLRDSVRVADDLCVRLSVVCCSGCGHIYQYPRFNEEFYSAYYRAVYRQVLTGSPTPSASFLDDQLERGEALFRNLSHFLPRTGRLLDVGCSSGGVMEAFLKRGWTGAGTDPDSGYVEYGKRMLNAPVLVQRAEEMVLERAAYDLVLIIGSLEHIYDPNRVLALCRRASAEGAYLLVEGHGLGQARQVGRCGHNHRRFLTRTSIELLMLKHGWDLMWLSDRDLSGPTRPYGIYGLGRAGKGLPEEELKAHIADGTRETCSDHRAKLDAWGIM